MEKQNKEKKLEVSSTPQYGWKLFFYIIGQLFSGILGLGLAFVVFIGLLLGGGDLGQSSNSVATIGYLLIVLGFLVAIIMPIVLLQIAIKKTFNNAKNRRKILVYLVITPCIVIGLGVLTIALTFSWLNFII